MRFTRSFQIGLGIAAVGLAGAMLVGIYHLAAQKREQRRADGPDATTVAITASACEPAELTVPAGRVRFAIINRSDRALEWEILKGVLVVDERENIAPGFTQGLTARLEAGEYEITCGLLSNPRGRLHVQGAAAGPQPRRPTEAELVGPIAEYEVFVIGELEGLKAGARDLAAAVRAGDLGQARRLYPATLAHYARIMPMAGPPAGLEAAFRALATGLAGDAVDDGVRSAAERLVAELEALDQRLETLTPAPGELLTNAAVLMRAGAGEMRTDRPETWRGGDLAGLRARLEGIDKLVGLLRPLTSKADSRSAQDIDADLAAASTQLAGHRPEEGGRAGDGRISREDRDRLSGTLVILADGLDDLRQALGLES